MAKKMVKRVESVSYHRNGITGEGFHCVLFRSGSPSEPDARMVAVVFEPPGACAVLKLTDLVDFDPFGPEGYRGDLFEGELRRAIKEYADGRPK